MAFFVFRGGLLRDLVPGPARFGADDARQGAAAKGRVHLFAESLENPVGVAPEKILLGPDPDFFKFRGRRPADVRQIGQPIEFR